MNAYATSNINIDIIYDPDKIKLLGTQIQDHKFTKYAVSSQVRVFFKQYPRAIWFTNISETIKYALGQAQITE